MKKYLPYILIGLPLLVGGFLVYGYVRKSKKIKEQTPAPPVTPEKSTITTTTQTTTQTSSGNTEIPLKKGSKGKYVQDVQKALGITADGDFGKNTDAAVRAYQEKYGLTVDGIVGKKTWKSLFDADFPFNNKQDQVVFNYQEWQKSPNKLILSEPELPTPSYTPKVSSIVSPYYLGS
jgi:peptidoglycan hydrolase-like protein with peptidoglycan-binding domain